MSEPSSTIQTFSITWQRIAIAVSYEPNWHNLSAVVGTCALDPSQTPRGVPPGPSIPSNRHGSRARMLCGE
jgi:hypothetical protein